MAIYKDLLLLNKLKNSFFMYQNCISSKPIGSVWKIKHDHSDNSGSSLTSVRISSYIDVKFGFLFYLKHSFLRENYKSFEKKLLIRFIWLYTKSCCSSRGRLFGNLINLKGLWVNTTLSRFSIEWKGFLCKS